MTPVLQQESVSMVVGFSQLGWILNCLGDTRLGVFGRKFQEMFN